MFNSILVPIDLADTDLAKPALATAATLAQPWSGTEPYCGTPPLPPAATRGKTGSGPVHLLNGMPRTPVMPAEYGPADSGAQQREAAEEALSIVARESGIPAGRITYTVRQGGIYH